MLLVIDDYPVFKEVSEQAWAGVLGDRLSSIAQAGPAVGVHVVLSASQSADLRYLFANLFSARVLLRQVDSTDYQLLDLRIPNNQAPNLPPGRALVAGGLHVQVARPNPDWVQRVAARYTHEDSGRPRPLPRLPAEINLSGLTQQPGGAGIVVGIGAGDAGVVRWDPSRGEPHLLVLGEAQTGRSTTLCTLVHAALADGIVDQVVAIAPRSSAVHELAGRPGVAEVARTQSAIAEALEQLGTPAATPRMLIIDDADALGGGFDALEALLRGARDHRLVTVVAGRTSDATRMFDGWMRFLLSQRTGLLLMPTPDAGFVFETRLPKVAAPMVPGRGFLVERAAARLVQVALAG